MSSLVVHRYIQPFDVFIGRGSKWGNPYSHIRGETKALYKVKTRAEALQKYREWIFTQVDLLEAILAGELDGKVLGCYCKPKDCHGDILVELTQNKELVLLSLTELKKKIEAQKAAQRERSPLNQSGIAEAVKRTPVALKPNTQPPAPVDIWVPDKPKIIVPTTTPPPPIQVAAGASGRVTPAKRTPKPPAPPTASQEPERQQQLSLDPHLFPPETMQKHLTPQDAPRISEVETFKKTVGQKRTPKLGFAQAEALLKGGGNVLAQPIPTGYTAVGKHDVALMQQIKAMHILRKICSFDYESTGDPDDETQDPQDHKLVGTSTAYEVGTAFYFPVGHDNYGANWDRDFFVNEFLRPILEHPEVYLIAHNVKFEHQMSLLLGIDFMFKAFNRKVMDTMLLVKALALPENTEPKGESGYEVVVGLKPATKALLADTNGIVHGLLAVDEIKSFVETVGKITWEEPIPGEYYKVGPNKGLPKMKKKSQSRTFNMLPVNKETTDYGCSDSDWALGLCLKLMPLAIAEGVDEVLYELDVPFMMILGEYEMAGWHIDRTQLEALGALADVALKGVIKSTPGLATHTALMEELRTKWTPQEDQWFGLDTLLQDALVALAEGIADIDADSNVIVPCGVYPMGKWRGEAVFLEIKTSKVFNWGSTQHKQWLFYHLLKMDLRDVSRSKTTGLPSTDGDTVDKLITTYSGDGQFMKILMEKSSYDKINSTYVNGMLPFCRDDTGKLHTNMGLVATWRLSSKKPNLQNIPRADNDPIGIRGVFVAPIYDPEADYSHLNIWTKPVSIITEQKLSGLTFYVNSDYAQIELKVLAWYAGEKGMIDILANGGDIHSWVAKKVFKLMCALEEVKELFKPLRYRSKKVNFGIVFGMTEFGLAADPLMGMTVAQAEQFIAEYMATFPGVKTYGDEVIAFARKYGYVETMFKHRRPIPEINHPNKWIRKKGENKAMNTPIQGSAADLIRLAMVNIRKEQPRWFKGVMQIHDEIQAEIPVEYGVEGCDFLQKVMEREVEGFSNIMPITSEPAIGATWATALELKRKPDGTPYVKPKKAKKEATDVTYDMIAPYEHYYKLAGVEIA